MPRCFVECFCHLGKNKKIKKEREEHKLQRTIHVGQPILLGNEEKILLAV
jgi:hypothetical protein